MSLLNSLLTNIRSVSSLGLRSILKSIYNSYRYTDRIDALIVGENVICDICGSESIDIGSGARFLFATADKSFGATHPDLGKSKLSVTESGNVRITSGNARIGPCSVLHVEGEFSMGASYINSHSRIICGDKISIGDGCAIAWNVELLDDDRHELRVDGSPRRKTEPIVIGDNVWIGNNVLVKKGVTIESGAIVASGSVVTEDVPSRVLVGGHPAEILRRDVEWS